MIVFLNGKFVRDEDAVVSIHDRGFLYGDGIFEGILVRGGEPFGWDEHMERFAQGVATLQLTLPCAVDQLLADARELIRRNRLPEAMLRLSLSRGVTARGYSPRGASRPTLAMTLHPAPLLDPRKLPRWRVVTSSFRLLADDPLARFKTANKLTQVTARAEADAAGANEALLLNSNGFVAEGTTSNLFWIEKNGIGTPPLQQGALPGVTRRLVMELCVKMNIKCRERKIRPAELRRARGAFLTMSSMGVVEIESLDGRPLPRSPVVRKIWRAYGELLRPANSTSPNTKRSMAARPPNSPFSPP